MSNTDVKSPDPGDEERALQAEQTALLREQRDILSRQMREQQLLAPLLFGEAGIEPIYSGGDVTQEELQRLGQLEQREKELQGLVRRNPGEEKHERALREVQAEMQPLRAKGEIVGYRKAADELAPLRQQIEKGFLERTLAAQRGELPVDPALHRELGEQEAILRETMRKQLGPGWETGTPGGGRLADFTKRKLELFDAARRGDLTLAEQLGMAREQGNQQRIDQFLGRTLGINQSALPFAQGFGQTAAGYNPIMSLLQGNRQMQLQSRGLTAQLDMAKSQQLTGMLSDIIGAAAMGAAASTAKVKKDIVPLDKDEYRKALKEVRDMPITRWRYLNEPDDREPHIGPILELSPKKIRIDENRISLLDYLGLTTAAVKGLDREVQSLRKAMARH